MSVKKLFLFFYKLSNITVSCFLLCGCDDLGSILIKSHNSSFILIACINVQSTSDIRDSDIRDFRL